MRPMLRSLTAVSLAIGAAVAVADAPAPCPFADYRQATAVFAAPFGLPAAQMGQVLERLCVRVAGHRLAAQAEANDALLAQAIAVEHERRAGGDPAELLSRIDALAPQISGQLDDRGGLVRSVLRRIDERRDLSERQARRWQSYLTLWRLGAQHRRFAWETRAGEALREAAAARVEAAVVSHPANERGAWIAEAVARHRADPANADALLSDFLGGARTWEGLSGAEKQRVVAASAAEIAVLAEWAAAELRASGADAVNDAAIGRALVRLAEFAPVDAAFTRR